MEGIGRPVTGHQQHQSAGNREAHDDEDGQDQPVDESPQWPRGRDPGKHSDADSDRQSGRDRGQPQVRGDHGRPPRDGNRAGSPAIVRARARDPRPTLGLIALVAVAAGLAMVLRIAPLAPPALAAQASPSASTTVGGDATAGRDLFLANCASCHGPQGNGSAVAPDITGAGAALADYVLRTGRMPLPDPKAPSQRRPVLFTDDQIRALVGFIASLDSGPAIPNVAVSGADLALGRSLFIDNCAACHGAGGAGGAVGGGFIAPSLHDADPTTVGEAVTVGPGPMPRFAFNSERLNALAAYVQELRNEPAPGGLPIAQLGPVPEGFLAGFVGIVLLLLLVRWIGRRPMGEADAGGAVTVHEPAPIENP